MFDVDLFKSEDPLADCGLVGESLLVARQDWIKKQLADSGCHRELRVLIGSNGCGIGGAESQMLRVIPELNRLGVHVEHLYYEPKHALKQNFEEAGIHSIFVDRSKMNLWQFMYKQVTLLRKQKYDIAHSFVGTANFYVRCAALLAHIPVRIAGSRNRFLPDHRFRFKVALSLMNPFTQAWIANAKTNLDGLCNLWWMKSCRVYVVPNSLDFERFDYTKPVPLDEDLQQWVNGRKIVGAVGRSAPQKNFNLFIDLAKELASCRADVCFCLVGGPTKGKPWEDEYRRLHQRIEKENLSGFVRMLGSLDDVTSFLPNLTMLVCTSDWEGCPNVVIEAMRAARPVVMTKCTDTSLLIEEGHNGYVTPLGDCTAMAEKVEVILNCLEKQMAMGLRGRQLAQTNFSLANSAWQMALVYLCEWQRWRKSADNS